MPARRSAALAAAAALTSLAAAACGGSQHSTLPPAPGRGGTVALSTLAAHPEVYSDARITTTGVVHSARIRGRRHYTLTGPRGGTRIVLEPARAVPAADLGRSVRVSGIFTVGFALGYEVLVSAIDVTH